MLQRSLSCSIIFLKNTDILGLRLHAKRGFLVPVQKLSDLFFLDVRRDSVSPFESYSKRSRYLLQSIHGLIGGASP